MLPSPDDRSQSPVSKSINDDDISSLSWEGNTDLNISEFSELPSKTFGFNQHMLINEEFKEVLRQIIWQFRAPVRYAFAYGSGVFSQQTNQLSTSKVHPYAPEAIQKVQAGRPKMIDFIFGVSYSQHWHDINLDQHRDHYSALGSLGSYAVSRIQDRFGAGVYFNPYITVNGTLIKYGVVNIDMLCQDLSNWNTMYLAGRLQKPVKILRDHPRVRLANQINLLSAVRVALLTLPHKFTEKQLYSTIAGMSYIGDPRMSFAGENMNKVEGIVSSQMDYFRRLYAPLIETMPNVAFDDPQTSLGSWVHDPSINVSLVQDMDPIRRGNMVRRLPKSFLEKLYFQYQTRFQIPRAEFINVMKSDFGDASHAGRRMDGREFEQRIASDQHIKEEIAASIKRTVSWPSTSQSIKSFLTAGVGRSYRYMSEKRQKYHANKNN